jgi:hypothetical protein
MPSSPHNKLRSAACGVLLAGLAWGCQRACNSLVGSDPGVLLAGRGDPGADVLINCTGPYTILAFIVCLAFFRTVAAPTVGSALLMHLPLLASPLLELVAVPAAMDRMTENGVFLLSAALAVFAALAVARTMGDSLPAQALTS